jgi:hypothetical protein
MYTFKHVVAPPPDAYISLVFFRKWAERLLVKVLRLSQICGAEVFLFRKSHCHVILWLYVTAFICNVIVRWKACVAFPKAWIRTPETSKISDASIKKHKGEPKPKKTRENQKNQKVFNKTKSSMGNIAKRFGKTKKNKKNKIVQ